MSETNVLPVGYVLRGPELTYKIVSVLGRGGFGITYLAEAVVRVGNVSTRVRFAIKEHFMSGECEREGESMRVVCSNPVRERVQNSLKDFISEARRLHKVGVDHPNIVKVNEVFEANGTAYYVMECLEGESLRAFVKRRGPLAEDEMLAIMRPVVDAVRYLHSARMTHLDIKPDNIMLTRDEHDALRPVLIDFGLAKHYDKDGRPTSTINILGCSEGYAPMEQYAGITTFSPAADCYALGATMWFCLTGKTPPKSTTLRDGQLAAELGGRASEETRAMIDAACRVNQYDRTFPGLAAPASDAATSTRWHAPSASTQLIDKPRRFPVRIVAACAVALALIVAAILGIRSCGSAPAVPAAPDSLAAAVPVADTAVSAPIAEELATPEPAAPVAEATPAAQPAVAPTPAAAAPAKEEEPAPAAPAKEEEPALPRFSTSPIDMALCAKGPDGYVYYITSKEWHGLSESEKSSYSPRGIYVAAGHFLVELHDKEGGNARNWYSAMKYNLPTRAQAEVIANNKDALNKSMGAFEGSVMRRWYWTKTENDSDPDWAWYLDMSYAHRYLGSNGKNIKSQIRAVAPVP